jgi:hypothetical protein
MSQERVQTQVPNVTKRFLAVDQLEVGLLLEIQQKQQFAWHCHRLRLLLSGLPNLKKQVVSYFSVCLCR